MDNFETIKTIVVMPTGKGYRASSLSHRHRVNSGQRKTVSGCDSRETAFARRAIELYVKIPADKALSVLDIEHLESVVILPESTELGDVYIPDGINPR